MRSILTLLFCLILSSGFCQTKKKPSVKKDLSIEKKDTVKLHALILLGTSCDTGTAQSSQRTICDIFEKNGVIVHKFSYHQAKWEEIKKIAPLCNFLFYHGHGLYSSNTKSYGGLVISEVIYPKQIESELKLKNNSIVIFDGVCGGAGSSASDNTDIGFKEAKKRVLNSSEPFFKVGTSVYYASNSDFSNFMNSFFEGKPISECRKENRIFFQYSTDTSYTEIIDDKKLQILSYPPRPGFATLITTSSINGKRVEKKQKVPIRRSYNVAIYGPESFSIKDMKK